MFKLMYGVVHDVFPPGNPQNVNAFQYEYFVLATGDLYTQIPLHHVIREDRYGATDEYEDEILEKGQKVLVMCLNSLAMPVIIGAIRNSRRIMDPALGHYSLRRFNKIETMIDKASNWSVKSDSGPNAQVNTTSIILDDSVGDKITLDKANKRLILESNEWQVEIKGNATINVGGEATVTAKGKVTVNGSEIDLNGSSGEVVTTETHPVDFMTGIPIPGTSKVKAGR